MSTSYNSSGAMTRYLAALVALAMVFSFSFAAPTPTSDKEVAENELDARMLSLFRPSPQKLMAGATLVTTYGVLETPARPVLKHLVACGMTLGSEFTLKETFANHLSSVVHHSNFFAFTQKGQKFGSSGFDSCTGVLIVGTTGAIIGHYTTDENEIKGTSSAFGPPSAQDATMFPNAAAHNIGPLFAAHGAQMGTPVKAYIYAQVTAAGEYVFPDMIAALVQIVTTGTGTGPKVKTYKTGETKPTGFVIEVKSSTGGADVNWFT